MARRAEMDSSSRGSIGLSRIRSRSGLRLGLLLFALPMGCLPGAGSVAGGGPPSRNDARAGRAGCGRARGRGRADRLCRREFADAEVDRARPGRLRGDGGAALYSLGRADRARRRGGRAGRSRTEQGRRGAGATRAADSSRGFLVDGEAGQQLVSARRRVYDAAEDMITPPRRSERARRRRRSPYAPKSMAAC